MLEGKLWMVLVDASCYVVKKSMYVWIYRGTKKTFVDHQPSAKTLITLHVMFSAIFSTVYIREIMIYYLNGETDLYQQKNPFLPPQSVTLFLV